LEGRPPNGLPPWASGRSSGRGKRKAGWAPSQEVPDEDAGFLPGEPAGKEVFKGFRRDVFHGSSLRL
ncbi:MAG: hypothetical protein ACREMY_00060, partial [bacterium]